MLSLATVTLSPRSFGDLLERRSDHPARTAPFRPEIDENGPVGAEYVGGEALVGDGLGGHGERISCMGSKLTGIWALALRASQGMSSMSFGPAV